MKLEYRVEAVGQAQLARVLRGIEGEARASATRQVRLEGRTSRERVSIARKTVKAQLDPEKEKARQLTKAHQLRMAELRAEERAIKQQTNAMRLQTRIANEQLRQSKSRTREMERQARQDQRIRERTAGRMMTSAARIGNGARVAVVGAALTASAAMGSAVMDRAAFDSQVRKVTNAGFDPSKHGTREQLAARIKSTTAGINKTSGMEESEVLRGLSAGIGISGDIDGMLNSLAELEKVASGTGADIGDIGETFGTLLKSFEGMPDAAKRATDMLYTLAGQGDLGAVELKDMATQGSKLSGAVVGMSGDKVHNLRTMSALMQLSRVSGATSAEEAGTSITALKSDLTRSAGALKKQGINVFDANGQMNDPRQLLADIIAKMGNDPAAMGKIFQEQSRKSVTGLVDIFQQAGGGAAGKAAIGSFFDTKDKQTVSAESMSDRAAFVAGGADRRLGAAKGDFDRQVGEKLLPALTGLIEPVSRLTPYMVQLADATAKAVDWFAENPFAGLGVIVGAKIGEEIVAAKIGDIIRRSLEGSTPVPPGVAPGTAPGKGGGWKGLANAGIIGTAVAGAMDFGAGLYNAEDKSEFLGKKFSYNKSIADIAGMTGISSIPGLGNAFGAMQLSNSIGGMINPNAAAKEQGGGLADAIKELSVKLDSLFGSSGGGSTVQLDDKSISQLASAMQSGTVAQNRYSPMTKL